MKKTTIDDVAKAAGVAKSTVSRIINNRPGVKPKTRKLVLEKIQELGFTPNISAQSLKTNRKKQIALAIDDIRNPYYPELAWAAEQVARSKDYRLVLVHHYGNSSEEMSIIESSNELHVDGIILVSINYPKNMKNIIKKSNIPVSLIGDFAEDIPADAVFLTKNEGILAMEHLIRIGRTRIAYAGGPKESHNGGRFAAYVNSLKSNFMPYSESFVFIGSDFSLQTGIEAAQYFANLDEKPDAVFAGNDMIAIGLIRELEAQGLRIPEDVAVIGIDDIKWSVITTPKVSTVSNLSNEMGRIAVEMLLERIEKGSTDAYKRIKIEPRLVVRDSTVKPT